MIYVKLRGRIGNQLFIYAFAQALRADTNENIVINDSEVLSLGWRDSLPFYNLENVEFVHKHILLDRSIPIKLAFLQTLHQRVIKKMPYQKKFDFERRKQPKYNNAGYIACENGYLEDYKRKTDTVVIDGYFQSEKYFYPFRENILKAFTLKGPNSINSYPNLKKIMERETVCISIKVEHNIGSKLYDVCTPEYWSKAIKYVTDRVSNPLFFICSDNVEYVINNVIDSSKYDYVLQDNGFSVEESLAVMSLCKHFIIGNTTFGWWAQYLSKNENKIVCVPSKWMLVDMPIDIYQDGMVLIDP